MSLKPTPNPIGRKTTGFSLGILLGLVLLLVSFIRLMGDLGSPAFDMSMVETALAGPVWQTRLGLNIALFALALLSLHLGFGLACWLLGVLSGKAFPSVRCSRRQWILLWFLAGAAWLLLANAARFAHSSLGEHWHAFATTRVLGATPATAMTVVLIAAIVVVLFFLLRRTTAWRRRTWLLVGAASLAVGAAGFIWHVVPHHQSPVSHSPHIIFLGIDSLRPDFVNADTAPHIRAFMDGAVQFKDAVTPLARTFPSWISILTGRHPHTTGALMNLLPRELIHTGTTLPQLLHERGYRTYYSMDETRFANIDASYGFDRTLTSAIGGSDFVLSWFADTPLSNVVMNTWLGALLFPHVHANRAAHVTYDPDAFVRRVSDVLATDRPLFLVSHLTLPHWPYTWAASEAAEPDESAIPALYELAVRRADQQFSDLLTALKRSGILEDAIVVVLSDHGEALGHTDDFLTDAFPADEGEAPKAQQWGHGTSVFSPTQYHVVLGIRTYGSARALLRQPAVLSEPVSLVDLTPTILDLLNIRSSERFDGISLASLLRPGADSGGQSSDRIRFTETEYNPQGFLPSHVTKSALAEAMKIYRLDSATDRLLVRRESIDMILSTRQYAALLGKSSMAIAIPDHERDGKYEFIQIPDPARSGAASASDAVLLRHALHERFGIQFANTPPSRPVQ